MREKDGAEVVHRYLPIIRNYYPNISPDSITVFQDGYDHDVLLINNHDAFRFPRSIDHGKKDHVENEFLHIFAKTSPCPVQDITGYTDAATGVTYQRYDFIRGVPLSIEAAATLTEQESEHIAVNMGKFLTKLHSFPIASARSMGMDELDPVIYWKYFEDLVEVVDVTVSPLLLDDDKLWIKKLFKDYISIIKESPFDVTVTHSDLLSEHILINETTHELNGIIDFSLRIADPANDFKFFDRYGQAFLKTVYANYPPVDKYFDWRRQFYAGYVPIINLHESIVRKDDQLTRTYQRQLKEYIAQTITAEL